MVQFNSLYIYLTQQTSDAIQSQHEYKTNKHMYLSTYLSTYLRIYLSIYLLAASQEGLSSMHLGSSLVNITNPRAKLNFILDYEFTLSKYAISRYAL
jgi:hypothetical protein